MLSGYSSPLEQFEIVIVYVGPSSLWAFLFATLIVYFWYHRAGFRQWAFAYIARLYRHEELPKHVDLKDIRNPVFHIIYDDRTQGWRFRRFFYFCLTVCISAALIFEKNSIPIVSNFLITALFMLFILWVFVTTKRMPEWRQFSDNKVLPTYSFLVFSNLLCFTHNLSIEHMPNHPHVVHIHHDQWLKISHTLFFHQGKPLPNLYRSSLMNWGVLDGYRWSVCLRGGMFSFDRWHELTGTGILHMPRPREDENIYKKRHVPRKESTRRSHTYRPKLRRYRIAAFKKLQFWANDHPVYFTTPLFLFILFSNFIGMVPYSFALTSQLIVTFTLAFIAFVGLNYFAIRDYGWHFLELFLPSGVPLFLAPFVIGIEAISYIARVFSLGIRLFANIMAGHTLLKILAGFICTGSAKVLTLNVFFLPFLFVPILLFCAIILLELAIAFLQAYVFTVLVCLYINDVHSIGSH